MPLWNSSRHRRIPPKKIAPKGRGFTKFLIVLLVLGGIGFYLYNSSFLKVHNIKITGIDQAEASQIYGSILDSLKDQRIYSIQKGYVTNLIDEKFPNLKLNEIKYEFPNKFEVNLTKREEKYHIQAANGTFTTDNEGFVLGETKEASPSINLDVVYDKSLEVGKKVQDASLQAGLIYSQLGHNIKIDNGQIHFDLENGGQVILPENAAVSKVNEFYSLLQKIIQKYTIDNRQIEFIDLRFAKPVIKYL